MLDIKDFIHWSYVLTLVVIVTVFSVIILIIIIIIIISYNMNSNETKITTNIEFFKELLQDSLE